MDAIKSLYLTTEGRISRKSWWLGVLGLIVASLIISIVLGFFGLGFNAMPAFDPNNPDMAAMAEAASAATRASAWGGLITYVILAYPMYAISVKRRHDRDNSGMDILIYMAAAILLLLVQALGLGMSNVDVGGGVTMPVPSMALSIAFMALGIFAIYLLVVLGFLRGTAGANGYGPDPLGGTASAAA